MKNVTTYVGIDAHKKDLFVAMLMGQEKTPVTWQLANEPNAVRRLVRKLEREAPGPVSAVYEAGPCGYALQRQMTTSRVSCAVIAPAPGPAPLRLPASAAARPSATPRGPVPPACAHRGDSSSPGHRASAESAPARPRRSSHATSSPAVATRSHTVRLHRRSAPVPGLRARAFSRDVAPRAAHSGSSRYRRCLVADQHRDEQVLLVRVDPHIRSTLFHDRLPSMRLWRPRALTRDSGGLCPPC